MEKQTVLTRLNAAVWTIFLNGLLTILPITLTIALINVSYKVIKGWLKPIYQLEPQFLRNIPFSEFFLVIFAIFLIGLFLSVFVLHPMVHAIEKLISKIPLIRPVYNGIKQLINAFNPNDTLSFKQVVLIEFPHKGMYSIGFLTSECSPQLSPFPERKFYNIFVPTTPNPTTGFFIMAGEEDVRIIDLSRQEAMALIISGGIIQPERFNK